jgi:single-strand DNA-binding protein
MANLNKVMLIGRLTRDPELRTFSNGGKVAKVGFAVNNRKRDPQTGEWGEEPVFLDVEFFNRGERTMADRVAQTLSKGRQIFIEGRLRMDSWTTPEGQKRNKLVIVGDYFEYLDPRDSAGGGGPPREQRSSEPVYANGGGYGNHEESNPPASEGNEDDIPF